MLAVPDETALEVERAAHGLRLRGTQLYLEPIGRPQLGFLAHARGARAILPERTVATAGTVALLETAQPRALRKAAPLPAAWGKPFSLGTLTLTVHPAGHVLGSAQLECEVAGKTILYASDLGGAGTRAPATAEPLERVRCDVLLLRATYGHPRYAFPPRAEVLEDLSRFVATARRRPSVTSGSTSSACTRRPSGSATCTARRGSICRARCRSAPSNPGRSSCFQRIRASGGSFPISSRTASACFPDAPRNPDSRRKSVWTWHCRSPTTPGFPTCSITHKAQGRRAWWWCTARRTS